MWVELLFIIHCVFSAAIQFNKIPNYKCEVDSNCTNRLPNSICFNKKCILKKQQLPHRRQINSGMRMLGEECDWANECRRTPTDGTKVCLARKCECSQGYVAIDAYRCIQDFVLLLPPPKQVTKSYENEPLGYGSVCSINSDCQHNTMYLECLHGTCVCLDGYVPLGKHLCFSMRGQESSTIINLLSSTTSTHYPINNEVIKSLGKLGNTCTNDYFCRRTVSQSHCYNGQCTCMNGFIPIDQYTCMQNMNEETTPQLTTIPIDYKSLLGGKCLTKRNCHTSTAVCLDSICSCPKGYFPVDDWSCLQVPESSDEELIETTSIITTTATSTFSTTTIFRWWPWSPTPTTRHTSLYIKNAFRVRCLLNRQCASMDKNSHCTLFGRCICNRGYQLETTNRGQHCIQRIINENDCD
ncbi:unnamed protein product [Adineta steineri]|uniref:EB domain-containing protein n=1 Tax=Adineta steineri TaxID=433720 RepID=A0A813MHZ3_9BILA|nr:unnamed protein product [Adineta steineri]CAF3982150.1 unnamed protein product [Adineta steineri]